MGLSGSAAFDSGNFVAGDIVKYMEDVDKAEEEAAKKGEEEEEEEEEENNAQEGNDSMTEVSSQATSSKKEFTISKGLARLKFGLNKLG